MLKGYATVIIGITTLLMAAFTAYGITTVSTQPKVIESEPINIPDYSDELVTLHSEIRAIKSDLVVLNTLRTDISGIQAKLVDLEKKSTQVEKIVAAPRIVTLDLDKSVYLAGETIRITATGLEPQKSVQIQFLDGSFVLASQETLADSVGKIMYNLKISTALPTGSYQVKIISGSDVRTEQISINTSSNTNSVSSGAYIFTVNTDKSIYQEGEVIEMSGTGKPNTSVTGILTSPTGKTYTTNSSTQGDGKYVMFFVTPTNAENGRWHITTNHVEKTIVVSITIA